MLSVYGMSDSNRFFVWSKLCHALAELRENLTYKECRLLERVVLTFGLMLYSDLLLNYEQDEFSKLYFYSDELFGLEFEL